MRLSERVGVYLLAVSLNAALLGFGVLMLVQGAAHKISVGEAEMRDIIVERSIEPFWFWVSVSIDAVVGVILVIASIYGFWLTFWRRAPAIDPDDSG